MSKTTRYNLTRQLQKLINQYPDCSWLKELSEMNLKNWTKPLIQVTPDNIYTDVNYKVFIFDN